MQGAKGVVAATPVGLPACQELLVFEALWHENIKGQNAQLPPIAQLADTHARAEFDEPIAFFPADMLTLCTSQSLLNTAHLHRPAPELLACSIPDSHVLQLHPLLRQLAPQEALPQLVAVPVGLHEDVLLRSRLCAQPTHKAASQGTGYRECRRF